MATELGKAYVQIIPSAKGISGSISSELSGEATSAGKTAGTNIAGAIKTAILAAGIGTALKSALEAGGALQQSFGGLDTLYEDAAESAKKYATEASKAGISANTYAEQAVSFGAALKQAYGGDTMKAMEAANTAILDMADNSAKMGTDITSIQNAYQGFAKQNYTMLDNLKLGYGGTKTEMERLLADATELSGIEYDISNLGDVYDAIHVIQENLGLTGVAAYEATETFTGSFNSMKASVENLLANLTLGEDIGPSMQVLAESVRAFLMNNMIPMIGNVLQQIPMLLTGLGDMIIQGIGLITENADGIVNLGIQIMTAIVGALVQAAPALLTAGVALVESLAKAFLSHDWLGEGTATVNSILSGLTDNIPKLLSKGQEILMNVVSGITTALPNVITAAGSILNTLLSYITLNLPYILAKGQEILLNVVQGIISSLPEIVRSAVSVLSTLLQTITEHLPEILEMGITLVLELITGLIECLPDLVLAALELGKGMIDAFMSIDWLGLGKNLIQGIINGIVAAGGALIDAAKNAAKAAFDAACDFLGIHSPATKGIYIGEMLDKGVASGVLDNKDLVDSAVTDLGASATSELALATSGASFDVSTTSNSKMDVLIAMLSAYLPEIASNKGITAEELYNGINRQLGMGLS